MGRTFQLTGLDCWFMPKTVWPERPYGIILTDTEFSLFDVSDQKAEVELGWLIVIVGPTRLSAFEATPAPVFMPTGIRPVIGGVHYPSEGVAVQAIAAAMTAQEKVKRNGGMGCLV